MIGRRVYCDEQGHLPNPFEVGDYGRATWRDTEEGTTGPVLGWPCTWWCLKAPDGSEGSLNPSIHAVTEHADGTLTVSPSIVTKTWHGWLKAGVWSNA